jgi:hypothetical protein
MTYYNKNDLITKMFSSIEFLQESVAELNHKTLDNNEKTPTEQYIIATRAFINGHLLTGFSVKFDTVDAKISSIWEATLYIGPRIVSVVHVELTSKRTSIPFFRSDSPLLLPLFLLDRWPIKIQLHQICGMSLDNRPSGGLYNRRLAPQVFINTKWLTQSNRIRLEKHADLQITYWPTHSIAKHQLWLVQSYN